MSARGPAPLIDWEDAFSNGDYIENSDAFPEAWTQKAKAFRDSHDMDIDLSYGDAPRMVMDLVRPKGRCKGLAVIVHGGYWLAFDKSSWTHLAQGALTAGWAVALPSYTLAPEATLPEITQQIGRAIAFAADKVAGPIHLAGHSAGGHLVTRMACLNGPLPAPVAARLARVVSISGLHDLRPLLHHSMNDTLGLTPDTAASESAALTQPLAHVDVTAWVGAQERPEFLRQSGLLAQNWSRHGINAKLRAAPDRHHFNVIDGLCDRDAPLTRAFVGDAAP